MGTGRMVYRLHQRWDSHLFFVSFDDTSSVLYTESKPFMNDILFGNYQKVEEQMMSAPRACQHIQRAEEQYQKAGMARPSFTSNHLSIMYEEKHDPEQYRALRLAAVLIFVGKDLQACSMT